LDRGYDRPTWGRKKSEPERYRKYPPGPNHNVYSKRRYNAMAKDEITSEKKKINERTQFLSDSLLELCKAKQLLISWIREGEADAEVLLLLVRATEAKIKYFEDKYHFRVGEEDQFYVEELLDFAKKAKNNNQGFSNYEEFSVYAQDLFPGLLPETYQKMWKNLNDPPKKAERSKRILGFWRNKAKAIAVLEDCVEYDDYLIETIEA
jgi:hypothetical protein